MQFYRSFILSVILAGISVIVAAQQKNMVNTGAAKGIVRDTTFRYVLKSATVSVYNALKQDSSLIGYQITNTYGEFNFKNLPVDRPLKLLISNVGYQSEYRTFTIPVSGSIDLKTIILNQKTISLKEVVVSVPPISMNGDTLEFNAAAFKLDSNAVVEDLLRKIPNIVLWGDGKITVNGREVRSLLVNGKEFFGGDYKIATQNLAKNAVEKIQVYKKAGNINPLDSAVEMNVKLKKGRDFGYFGKIGAGYGSNKRYESDANLNAFNSKVQISIVGADNNINKIAYDVRSLLANSTFKGAGTGLEYRPDFMIPGITRPRALGANMTYNFLDRPIYGANNILSLNYFAQTRDNDNSSSSETTTTTQLNGKILEEHLNARNSYSSNKNFDSKYEWVRTIHALTINQSFKDNSYQSVNESVVGSFNSENQRVSSSIGSDSANGKSSNYSLDIRYVLSENFTKFFHRFKGLSVNFSLNLDNDRSNRVNKTDFISFSSPNSNKRFNRKYQTGYNSVNPQLNFEFNNLKELLFGKTDFLGLDFSVGNTISINNRKNTNVVGDSNDSITDYQNNAYLSNQTQAYTIEETPNFTLSRSISSVLSNRFSKSLVISGTLQQKLIYQDNRSDKSFQNIRRKYSQFAPNGNIRFAHEKYGDFNESYSLGFNTSIRIPSLQELAPLIDSANIYNIQKGNLGLRESVTRALSFGFSHEAQQTKNTLNYQIELAGGITEGVFADSLLIADDNRRVSYLVNAGTGKYLNFSGSIRKALKLKTSELQISLNNTLNISRNPGYVNGIYAYAKGLNTNTSIKFNFTYKDCFALEGVQSYSTYKSSQETFMASYSGTNVSTTLSSGYSVTKKLILNSNITFNNSTATGSDAIKFAIWNAALTYRLLKGNNLETKFSALDLLRQNRSVINYGALNSFTIGSQNVLQHYFMATVSYYPRQFGKKNRKK
ncbi:MULTISPECIES: outer membrane beta-barrel protein [Pedobacter]|uniref:outer membrane beta-barrel protein n=1 Tax=Pedobacter TaxID=84567 RepID=UPI002930CD5E|nr:MULTISPECIES: hypothetical protein [Pedobacter]